jgi:EH domain-containing protein 1
MLQPQDVRIALENLVADSIVPIAQRYDYSPQTFHLQPQWKPVVLVIGNYSSGKSTLINELLGGSVQRTGQAPTDDCFTVIAGTDPIAGSEEACRVLEEVPGTTLINDSTLPFSSFKKFGTRFISHFLMKKVNSPILKNLVLIDSPGMLDSVAEQDRGYDYQEVIGQLAELADLVVLVFDPHRAGTIKETYVAIRSTLPQATSEDRVLFVLNRIDECKNLVDLVRCYGVLCWNLSQMTGRKDIPRVYLTFSPNARREDGAKFEELADERSELVEKIEQAPRLQISHLLGTVDHHLHKLELVTGTLARAARRYNTKLMQYLQGAAILVIVAAFALDTVVAMTVGNIHRSSMGRLFSGQFFEWPLLFLLFLFAILIAGVVYHFRHRYRPRLQQAILDNLDELAVLENRYRRDLWESVRPKMEQLLADPKNLSPFAPHRANFNKVRKLISEDMRQLYERHLGSNLRARSDSEAPEKPPVE